MLYRRAYSFSHCLMRCFDEPFVLLPSLQWLLLCQDDITSCVCVLASSVYWRWANEHHAYAAVACIACVCVFLEGDRRFCLLPLRIKVGTEFQKAPTTIQDEETHTQKHAGTRIPSFPTSNLSKNRVAV